MVYILNAAARLPPEGRNAVVLKFEPWGKDYVLEWDEYNQEKIWKHAIRDFEIEECFENAHAVRPHAKMKSEPRKYRDRYCVTGITHGGRRIQIIVQFKGGNNVRPITAWEIK